MDNLETLFNGIVAEYSERLYMHVRPMVASHEDADDLVQEIFIKVWKSLPTFRGDSQVFTWVWRIAHNEVLSFLRWKKVRAALAFENLNEKAMSAIDSDPWFNGDDAQRRLAKALARLPERQRMVFSMRYYEGLGFEEISQITGVSVGALKASNHIASEKIKQYILSDNV